IWARADKAVTHIGLHRFAASYTDAGGGPRIITQAVPLRVAPRDARAKKERGDGAGKREEPEPATAAEVTLAFLRAQIDSPRWGKPYRAWLRRRGLSRRQLIDRADLSDASQNAARVRLLGLATNNILNGLPAGTAWTRRMIAPAELGR